MARISNIKESINMMAKGFGDFLENLNNELASIVSDDDDLDMAKKYNRYKKQKTVVTGKESEQQLNLGEKVDCDNTEVSTAKKVIRDEKPLLNIEFTEENLMQGIIYSEILGKPKAKRRRR